MSHLLYLSSGPPAGRVWYNAFFKVGPGAGLAPTRTRHFQKYIGPRRRSPNEGRLRRQAMNLTLPKRVKSWGYGSLRPKGSPIPRHTRPDLCRWHGWPKCDPKTGEAHKTVGFGQAMPHLQISSDLCLTILYIFHISSHVTLLYTHIHIQAKS